MRSVKVFWVVLLLAVVSMQAFADDSQITTIPAAPGCGWQVTNDTVVRTNVVMFGAVKVYVLTITSPGELDVIALHSAGVVAGGYHLEGNDGLPGGWKANGTVLLTGTGAFSFTLAHGVLGMGQKYYLAVNECH